MFDDFHKQLLKTVNLSFLKKYISSRRPIFIERGLRCLDFPMNVSEEAEQAIVCAIFTHEFSNPWSFSAGILHSLNLSEIYSRIQCINSRSFWQVINIHQWHLILSVPCTNKRRYPLLVRSLTTLLKCFLKIETIFKKSRQIRSLQYQIMDWTEFWNARVEK